tara:strand:+ start:360 stop:914 length:555 start_codon:yes stop_codon:yes gene_type:complete
MATVYEIIQGLSQAAANAYDGALNEDGEAVEAGLKREQGRPLIDKRVMDGFNVSFYGNMMCLGYHSELQLREVYANGFEAEVEQQLSDIASFLKKEYKKITGKSVTLTPQGESDIFVENSSRVRTWVTAKMHYKIGGITESETINEPSADTVDDKFRKFLEQGGWNGKGGTRPDNDTRPKNSGE